MKIKPLAANAALIISIIAPVLIAPAGTTHGITQITVAVACVVIFSILAALLLAASTDAHSISALIISTEKRRGSFETASILLKDLRIFPRAFVFVPSDAQWSLITTRHGATVRAALIAHKQGIYFLAGAACLFAFVLTTKSEMGIVMAKFAATFGGSVYIFWALQIVASFAATGLLFFGAYIKFALIFKGSKQS